jgi:3-oxoacyl-[acyl-carrier protein] reductase
MSATAARSILITGANGVLGHAIARMFLEREPQSVVFLGTRSQRDRVDALIAEHPERAIALPLEVTSAEAWTNAAQQIEARGLPFAVLVNNAGFHDDALLATMTGDQWTSVIAGNLNSVFLGCQTAVNAMMRNRFGRIVNIASLSALHGPAGQTNYAAAKAGVLGLTQSLAKETARMGITVNAIAPAHIEGALPAGWPEEQVKAARLQTPMRRFARPEEIAAAVFFLASADASYITGATLKMDGGLV